MLVLKGFRLVVKPGHASVQRRLNNREIIQSEKIYL